MSIHSPASQNDTSPDTDQDPLLAWIGQTVILDTQGPLLYIGTLEHAHAGFLILTDADVHYASDSRSTRDFYLAQAQEVGVHVNRARVFVARLQVASVSRLSDVRT